LPSLVIYMFLNQITAKHNAADTCIDPAPFLGLFRASRGNLTLTNHMWAHPSVESIDSENISLPYLKHCQMEKNITITTHPIQRAGRKSVRKVKNGLAGEESARLMQTSCKCIPRFTTQTWQNGKLQDFELGVCLFAASFRSAPQVENIRNQEPCERNWISVSHVTLHTIKLHAINISLSRMILSYNSQLGIHVRANVRALFSIHMLNVVSHW